MKLTLQAIPIIRQNGIYPYENAYQGSSASFSSYAGLIFGQSYQGSVTFIPKRPIIYIGGQKSTVVRARIIIIWFNYLDY